ncbi:MAG TPA: RagB/SusD family nutrient uptake outer membrane protein, partial [Chitinophagaceae bacterium]|nr:RagB/SusD family nutrient uptake outer membrane protein [Chitinophagaceae bacterium]
MKKNIQQALFILLVGASTLTACKKDFLNTEPRDQVQASETWRDPALAEAFVNGIYGGLYEGGFDEQMLASITDEAIFTHAGRGINTINQGNLNADNTGWVNRHTNWLDLYNFIRTANIAIENLPNAELTDQGLKDRLLGEAKFLRAYYYHQLLRFYGGVPLITKVYGLGEDYTAERNTYAEVSEFILSETQAAYDLLKGKTRVRGRATDLAALALISRQRLYDASDLHDMPTASAKSTVISGFANKDLLGFTSGDRMARWTAARDAAKAVLDAAGSGYKTDLTAPVSPEQGRKNYLSIAMGGASKHPDADPAVASTNELLFVRTFTLERSEGAQQHGLRQGP